MKRLILCLMALAPAAFGAVGDWASVTVETNGWVLEAAITGYTGNYGTNGAFNFGFGSNYKPPGKLALTVVAPGFDDTGTSNTITRTIYATKQLRFPYPSDAYPDITTNGGNLVLRMALSDYIASNDVISAVSMGAGLYSNSTTVVSATNNSSTVGYSQMKCIANWTWPGWQRVTNNTMTLRATGFHRSSQLGRPLRVMQFVTQDQHSHAVTNLVTSMTVDSSMGDLVPVCEYVANVDVSSMTQGDQLRCDFTAYPWQGDSGAVLSTLDNANAQPTPLYSCITNLCDRTLALNGPVGTWAIVATNGNDSTGVACTNSPPFMTNCFLTINGALLAIQGTNNGRFGHTDLSSGTVYLTEGTNWTWLGGSGSYATVPKSWATVTRWTSNTVDQVCLYGQSGNKKMCNRDHVQGVTILLTNAGGSITGDEMIWIDQCSINSTSGVPFYINTVNYFTGNTITNLFNVPPYAVGVNSANALVRGNMLNHQLSPSGAKWYPYTFVGNKRTTATVATNALLNTEANGQTWPRPDGMIVAFNSILWRSANDKVATLFYNTNQTFGAAIVQNVFEISSNNSTPGFGICSDSSLSTNVHNIIMWNNNVLGQRVNAAYNAYTANATWRDFWSKKGNDFDDDNIKCDTFNESTYHQSATRIGNWSQVWGVGSSGNFMGNVNGVGVADFAHVDAGGQPGINTVEQDTSFAIGYQQFIDLEAYDGTSNKSGNGNYHLKTSSPLGLIPCDMVLPFDIEGNARSPSDPPGAYSSGAPRKTGMFF